MKNYIGIGIAVLLVLSIGMYGVFWLSKKISYEIFYEDLVQQTVKDMVKPEYLNEHYHK